MAYIIGIFHFSSLAVDSDDAELHSQIRILISASCAIDTDRDSTGFDGYIRHLTHRTIRIHEINTSVTIYDHKTSRRLVSAYMRDSGAV